MTKQESKEYIKRINKEITRALKERKRKLKVEKANG